MVVLFGMSANYAHANDTTGTSDATAFAARLSGFNEVPLTILSPGSGSVQVNIDRAASTITYTLTYADTTTPVTQAHIHFGKKHTAGGIIAFLCSNLANPPAGTPPCPQQGGTVNGTIAAGQVVAQEAQNIPAGDFNALVSAIGIQGMVVTAIMANTAAGNRTAVAVLSRARRALQAKFEGRRRKRWR
jgi:hypothetical protein